MITTLSTSGFLFQVNRNRQQYLTALEKRRSFLYCVGIAVCVTIATLIFVIYR